MATSINLNSRLKSEPFKPFFQLSLAEDSLENLKVPFFSFNTTVSYILKYFCAKFREILTSGSREIGVFLRKLFCIHSRFFDLLRMRCI